MTTHGIQFGRRSETPGRVHSHVGSSAHSRKVGNHFAMVKPKPSPDKSHEELVKQTQKWVAQTFYGELLKQMRNSPFKDKVFSGGRGGEAFTEMFDQKLAEKMASGSGRKLVDAIVNRIEAKKAYGPPGHGLTLPHKVRRAVPSPTLVARERAGLQ